MSAFKNPFDAGTSLTRGCSCGHHHNEAEHQADLAAQTSDSEALSNRVVEAAVMRALLTICPDATPVVMYDGIRPCRIEIGYCPGGIPSIENLMSK